MDKNANSLVIIRSHYPNMFESEKKIADFILRHPEDAVNMTVSALAHRTGVANSSVVRFCQRIGFRGFTQLKISVAKSMQKHNEYKLILDDINADDNPISAASKVFSSSIRALSDTWETIDKNELCRAVDFIIRAKRIEFYGVGTSASLASDAYYRLMRIGMPAYAATDPHIMRLSANMLDENCVAVGISHTGRTIDIIRTLEIARSKGARIICITSFHGSPVTSLADVKLVTLTPETRIMKEALTSRIAHIAVLDSIYACAALLKSETSLPNIENMTDILNETRLQK